LIRMVHGKTYRLPNSNRPVAPADVDESGPKPVHSKTREELVVSWEKMSKSKYNGIDPEVRSEVLQIPQQICLHPRQKVVSEYGSDTVRLFLLFKAPVDQIVDWDDNQVRFELRWTGAVGWNDANAFVCRFKALLDL